jgi:hypothetical protein
VVIQWLQYAAHVYSNRCDIGCQTIYRDNPTLDNEYADILEQFLPVLKAVWDTVFPMTKG